MAASVLSSAVTAELEPLKPARLRGETALQKMSPLSGALVAQALSNAQIEVVEAADALGISYSLLQRQLKNQEHLSWQRVFQIGEDERIAKPKRVEFQRHFVALLARAWRAGLRGAVRVDLRVV